MSFYLLRFKSGRIDDLTAAMRVEVTRASWLPLSDAAKLLAYKGEKEMARRALEYVTANPNLEPVSASPTAEGSRKAARR